MELQFTAAPWFLGYPGKIAEQYIPLGLRMPLCHGVKAKNPGPVFTQMDFVMTLARTL